MKAASPQPQKARRRAAPAEGPGGARRAPSRARARDNLRGEVAGVFKRAILDAAERVFGERGFAPAKMTEIAAGAGLAAGTLYNYFESKEEIFRALVEERGGEFLGALERIVAGQGGARHQLVGLTRATFSFIEAHSAMFSLLARPEAGDESVRRLCQSDGPQPCTRYLALFERCLAAARRQGVVRAECPPAELAQVLTGAMEGLVRGWFLAGRRPGRLAERAEFVVDLFIQGAGKRT